MLFNSFEFLVFFPIVFILYWFVFNKKLSTQNALILLASYVFYGFWDWRFLFLLAFSTFLGFYFGLKIQSSESNKRRKIYLWISVITNLSFLGFFKYFNFFIESFSDLLRLLGLTPHMTTLYIVLPVGISFYTFHSLSYLIDIYNKKIEPTRNWIDYSVFISFFPLLVAGPIERATHLLPQIQKVRTFDYEKAVSGLRQILWGFFKKVVIADSCAEYVDVIFNNYESYSGSTLLLGAVLFSFQIYGDFSGYSDIALGVARLMGFELLKNFNYPYFSRDIAEFWRRWHISLSSWFRDYVYIPLGGSQCSKLKKIRNTYIVFIVSGLWHGANWTFFVWGFMHATFMVPIILFRKSKKNLDVIAKGKLLPNWRELILVLFTFILTVFAWIFFRADNVSHACNYVKTLLDWSIFSAPTIQAYSVLTLIVIATLVEWVGRESNFAIENINKAIKIRGIRWIFYIAIILFIFANTNKNESFIYFQF